MQSEVRGRCYLTDDVVRGPKLSHVQITLDSGDSYDEIAVVIPKRETVVLHSNLDRGMANHYFHQYSRPGAVIVNGHYVIA
jgi:hypothetical protein